MRKTVDGIDKTREMAEHPAPFIEDLAFTCSGRFSTIGNRLHSALPLNNDHNAPKRQVSSRIVPTADMCPAKLVLIERWEREIGSCWVNAHGEPSSHQR